MRPKAMSRSMPIRACAALLSLLLPTLAWAAEPAAVPAPLDQQVRAVMAKARVQGLALAYIENGQVAYTATWGVRNADRQPLTRETVMYGASLTKMLFAYTVMQLVEEGKLELDRSIADYLPKPLRFDDLRAVLEREAWECRTCGATVHAECCDGSTLTRSPKTDRLSSTCRRCRSLSVSGRPQA